MSEIELGKIREGSDVCYVNARILLRRQIGDEDREAGLAVNHPNLRSRLRIVVAVCRRRNADPRQRCQKDDEMERLLQGSFKVLRYTVRQYSNDFNLARAPGRLQILPTPTGSIQTRS